MDRPEPTFYLLDRRTGRRTGSVQRVAVDPGAGIVLAAEPDGPLGLASTDGSLGGLRLPRGMAIDGGGLVHLLAGASVRRFDPARRRFVPLPGVGGAGAEPRRFDRPRDLAIAGNDLYVADTGNARVQAFDLRTLALVHLWTAPGGGDWDPVAATAAGGAAYLLDRAGGRVFRHRPGSDRLELAVDDPGRAGVYSGLAVDRDGRVHLLDASGPAPVLRVFDAAGAEVETVGDAGVVRSRFAPPAIRADHRGRFCLPASLARACDRRPPDRPPAPDDPLAACRVGSGAENGGRRGLLFDRRGRPVRLDPEEPAGPPVYARRGRWRSQPLDSRIHRCQWHRVEIELPALPAGSRVEVRTLTADAPLGAADLDALDENRWLRGPAFVGALQPPPGADDPAAGPERRELLVQSRQGRYLWLRLDLAGDGFSTPAVDAIRIHFPRRSQLDFLPAVYSAEEESRWFLERFLAILGAEWERIDETIDTLRRLFDPEAVPDEFVDFLAFWLALPLEGAWTAEQKRRLLAAAPDYTPRRGTLAGMRAVLQVYLWNLTGIPPAEQGEIPAVAEGFRERRRLLLGTAGTAGLGEGAPLWSRAFVARLQLGVFAREGEARLVSTGDPERDLFHEFAHRFRVFVPAGWVATDDDEALLRRAIDAEKPAHTQYDLCLVEPRLLAGVQSTAGFDSVLGDYSELRLACRHGEAVRRTPRPRLGIDAVLGCRPGGGGVPVGGEARVGIETHLT